MTVYDAELKQNFRTLRPVISCWRQLRKNKFFGIPSSMYSSFYEFYEIADNTVEYARGLYNQYKIQKSTLDAAEKIKYDYDEMNEILDAQR